MGEMREAFEKWWKVYTFNAEHKERMHVAFDCGYQAAIANVKAGGPVAEVHPNNIRPSEDSNPWCREVLLYSGNSPYDFLDGKNYRVKLYKLPEDV